MAHWIEQLFSAAVIAPFGAAWPFVLGGLVIVVLVIVDARRLRRRRRNKRNAAAPPAADSSGSGRFTVDLSNRK